MPPFPDFLGELVAECIEVAGVAAGDEPLIGHDRAVFPI